MNFEEIKYRIEEGVYKNVILANPHKVDVIGKFFLTGREVNENGMKIQAPRSYVQRHPEGDGMVWAMIPFESVIERASLVFDGKKMRRVTWRT